MSGLREEMAIFTRRSSLSRRVILRIPTLGFVSAGMKNSSPVGCGDYRVDDNDRGRESSVMTGGAE